MTKPTNSRDFKNENNPTINFITISIIETFISSLYIVPVGIYSPKSTAICGIRFDISGIKLTRINRSTTENAADYSTKTLKSV